MFNVQILFFLCSISISKPFKIVSKVVSPFFCGGIFEDNKYKVLFGYSPEGRDTVFTFRVYEFDSAEQMIKYLQYWYEYPINGLTPKQNYINKINNGEKLVRFEYQWYIHEYAKNNSDMVIKNPSICDKRTKKECSQEFLPQLLEICSPEMRSFLSCVKIESDKVWIFIDTKKITNKNDNVIE